MRWKEEKKVEKSKREWATYEEEEEEKEKYVCVGGGLKNKKGGGGVVRERNGRIKGLIKAKLF